MPTSLWCLSSVFETLILLTIYIEVEDISLMIDKGLFKACLSAKVTAYQK